MKLLRDEEGLLEVDCGCKLEKIGTTSFVTSCPKNADCEFVKMCLQEARAKGNTVEFRTRQA